MKYGSKEYNNILSSFKKGRAWLNDVEVEIVGGENELDPLTLLRAYDEEPTLENSVALTGQMILNKEVRFLKGTTLVHSFVYNGGDLGEKFAKVPYLLDTLIKLCYGLMIKKLTPPSEDSVSEERQ